VWRRGGVLVCAVVGRETLVRWRVGMGVVVGVEWNGMEKRRMEWNREEKKGRKEEGTEKYKKKGR